MSTPDVPDLLRRWRARRSLSDVPGQGAEGDGPITQTVMAAQLGVSERHYRRLESGQRPMSSDTIACIGSLLGLHPDEMRALYQWSGRPVPPLLSPAAPELPADLLEHIDRLPVGALCEAPDFTILAYNARAARNWPWCTRAGANIMTDLLLPGEGRDQCAQWEEHWAPPLLAQLRQASLSDGNTGLRAIVDQVCMDPDVRELWLRTAEVRRHAYGTVRPMYLPGWTPRPAWISVMGWQPLHLPGVKVVTGDPARSSREPKLPAGLRGGGLGRS
ncbi:helix-turn-helix domain-containing protein [Streptomyces microflavus]